MVAEPVIDDGDSGAFGERLSRSRVPVDALDAYGPCRRANDTLRVHHNGIVVGHHLPEGLRGGPSLDIRFEQAYAALDALAPISEMTT